MDTQIGQGHVGLSSIRIRRRLAAIRSLVMRLTVVALLIVMMTVVLLTLGRRLLLLAPLFRMILLASSAALGSSVTFARRFVFPRGTFGVLRRLCMHLLDPFLCLAYLCKVRLSKRLPCGESIFWVVREKLFDERNAIFGTVLQVASNALAFRLGKVKVDVTAYRLNLLIISAGGVPTTLWICSI